MLVVSFILSILAMPFGASPAPALVATANILAFATAIGFAWLGFAREIISPGKLPVLGRLVGEKAILYTRMMMGRNARGWVRTDRRKSEVE